MSERVESGLRMAYRGHRRWYLTKRAAAQSIAKAAVRSLCTCDFSVPRWCEFHDQTTTPTGEDKEREAIRTATDRVMRGLCALPPQPYDTPSPEVPRE